MLPGQRSIFPNYPYEQGFFFSISSLQSDPYISTNGNSGLNYVATPTVAVSKKLPIVNAVNVQNPAFKVYIKALGLMQHGLYGNG